MKQVAHIALDVYRRDSEASFFFIGAADNRDRAGMKTRRYRVYISFVNDLNLSDVFSIIELKDQSMCILLNRKAVPDKTAYMQRILEFID